MIRGVLVASLICIAVLTFSTFGQEPPAAPVRRRKRPQLKIVK